MKMPEYSMPASRIFDETARIFICQENVVRMIYVGVGNEGSCYLVLSISYGCGGAVPTFARKVSTWPIVCFWNRWLPGHSAGNQFTICLWQELTHIYLREGQQ